MPDSGVRSRRDDFTGLIDSISKLFAVDGRVPRSDAALLRRKYDVSSDEVSAAFWRVAFRHDPLRALDRAAVDSKDRDYLSDLQHRWAFIVHVLARLGPLHRPKRRPEDSTFGEALAQEDYSELRLAKLLRAREQSFYPAARRVVQLMQGRRRAFDVSDLASLTLAKPYTWEPGNRYHYEPEMAVRDRITLQYVRITDRKRDKS